MKRIIVMLAILAACLMPVSLMASPAGATTCTPFGNCFGGTLYHGNDGGYDRAIIVFCDFGDSWSERKWVEEGTSSKSDCGIDTDQIYIREGEQLWCDGWRGMPQLFFNETGRHKIEDNWHHNCTLRVDG